MGSIHCDQPLVLRKDFSSDIRVVARQPKNGVDEVLPAEIRELFPVTNGVREITDEDLPLLSYDAKTAEVKYSPEQGGLKWFEIIYGLWIKLSLTHTGNEPIQSLRFACCASVF